MFIFKFDHWDVNGLLRLALWIVQGGRGLSGVRPFRCVSYLELVYLNGLDVDVPILESNSNDTGMQGFDDFVCLM